MINQAKLRSFKHTPKFKYGFEVPKRYEQAVRLDEAIGNKNWQDATEAELASIDEYSVFIDQGYHTKAKTPTSYKQIRVHLIFDVKRDGRRKARLVADGHLTDVPLESVYSGMVSLRGFNLVIFRGKLNELDVWATDIGNAYLEAFTSEKVYIIAGTKFKQREGHILIISKELFGLRSSGARWHDRVSDCVSALGFFPCKSELDIWMRKNEDI
jgi:Reverse transcriptase (RNA-dependent DNA polymerase)